MARQRPTASDESQGHVRRADAGAIPGALTRAEARAHSRIAPLTPAEFKARRKVAAQLVDPLPMLLDRDQRDGSSNQARA